MEEQSTTTQDLLDSTEEPIIEVQVESFPVIKPKFTKETWESGEGGESDQTGESELRPYP